MGLDSQTLLLVGGCLYMLLPINTWLILSEPRTSATRVWCVGGTLGGVALFLMSLRGVIPDLLSYGAYSLLVVSILMLTHSMRMEMGKRWSAKWIGASGLVHVFVVLLLMRGQWAELPVLVRACNLLVLSWAIWTAVLLARRERSLNAWMIVLAFLVMSVAVLANLLASMRGESPLQDLRSGTANFLVGLTSMTGALLSNMGYLGLQLERALAHNTRALQAQDRATRRSTRRRQLVAQERPLTVGVLSDSLAHALLQPLAALVIHAQLGLRRLQQGRIDVALLGEVFRRMQLQLERIADQVEHIRKFILPAQPQQDSAERVDVGRVIRDVEPLVRQEAINQKVRLVLQLPVTAVWTRVEPLSLMQAVLQVVRNAVTAAAPCTPGEVRVAVVMRGEMPCIVVHDNGPGFHPPLLAQLESGRAPALGQSTGLGLWMAYRIMAASGGFLGLENDEQGGARVTLQCPRDPGEKSPEIILRAHG